MAAKGLISYWMLPVISSLFWLATLLGLLLYWIINTNSRHYSSMSDNQNIAYISDVGADELKPLFIAGSVVTTVFLDLSFVSERWLRHRGRLVPNTSIGEKILSGLTIVFALVGTAGLILLSVFDTARYNVLHNIFLLLFIAGYLLSAVFICWEYQRLGIKHRQHAVLRISFWIKLTFILVELVLAVVFAVTTFTRQANIAAIFEWIVAFVFTFYILSFVIDLLPAIHTKPYTARFEKPHERDMELANNGHNNDLDRSPYPNGYRSDTAPSNF